MDINFELYKIFYHAAKLQSFSDAAQALYISQSAVSQAVKNLEEKTGVQLFFRKMRKVKLTGEGELLFKHVEQAYNFIKTGEHKLHELQHLTAGEVRIGVSDTICKYFLIPYLEKFNQLYPSIKIQVINRTSAQIRNILENGLVELGIVTMPLDEKGFDVEEFICVEDIFVACDKFLKLKDVRVTFEQLVDYPLLLLQQNSATRRNLDGFLQPWGITLVPEIELESVDLLVEFARIGLGIAHVLRQSAAASIVKGELFEINLQEKLPYRKLGIITMRDVPQSRAADAFIRLLKNK